MKADIFIAIIISFMAQTRSFTRDDHKKITVVNQPESDIWSDSSAPCFMSIYIFNVLNPEEVEAGTEAPKLEEQGPYVYRQRRHKVDPWSDNCKETVKYQKQVTYWFDEEKSSPRSENDVVNVINVPFVSMIGSFLNRGLPESASAASFSRAMTGTESLIRRDVTIRELTFQGFPIPGFDILEPMLPPAFSGLTYGLYKGKNESTDESYEVYTGAVNPDSVGRIKRWNGMAFLPFWNTDECNRIWGTDGTIFGPNLQMSDSIEIFNPDLCRVLKLDFQKEVEIKGIKGYRYTISAEELQGPDNNPENACYCLKENSTECKDGTIDVSSCNNGAPMVLSLPHFLDGDVSLVEAVEGLSPVRDLHETIIDIEPITGQILGFRRRIQQNIEVKVVPDTPQFANLTQDIIFPVTWAEEEISFCDLAAKTLISSELSKGSIVHDGFQYK